VSASTGSIQITPGGSGSAIITVTGSNAFNGAVNLTVRVIGSPSGVAASVSPASISSSGSSTLSVSSSSVTPAGTFLLAITGQAGALQHTTYLSLGFPDFALSVAPVLLVINQGGTAPQPVTMTPQNGLQGGVGISFLNNLPSGITLAPNVSGGGTTLNASTSAPVTGNLSLVASPTASTGEFSLTVLGTSGTTTRIAQSTTLLVNAGTGTGGEGTPVDLSSAYNLAGIFADGTADSLGGLDGDGNAYSSTLLTATRILDGVQFNFGPVNAADAVSGAGQVITLPAGNFTTLRLLATGIGGGQASQNITVAYTDGTSTQFTQSFSDWFQPASYVNESQAVTMSYRNAFDGGQDNRTFTLYGYAFLLNSGKTVQSLTLPNNPNVIVLGATLTSDSVGTPLKLVSQFNLSGIVTDGATFAAGLDGDGAAYSANLLGEQAAASNLILQGVNFVLGQADTLNAVTGANTAAIRLPAGRFGQLQMLATAVEGNQTAQTLTVTYRDGTTAKFTQSFSDWAGLQSYPGESLAQKMAYRDLSDGTQDDQTFNLYAYTFSLDNSRTVQSLTLPNNRNVAVLAVTLR
jgi:hypothetical protein